MFNCTLYYGQDTDLGHLESIDRYIFSALYHTFGIITFIVNFLVCRTMIKTGMWKKNQSFKTLFGYSVIASLHGAFSCNISGYVMNKAESLSCVQISSLFFLPNIFGYSCHGTIMFLGLDRFLRVYFLNLYPIKVTSKRYYGLLSIYLTFSVWQGILRSYGRVIVQPETVHITLSVSVEMLFLVLTIILYILSIIKLRQHQKNSKSLGKTNRSITRLAKIYLIVLLVCYLPYFLRYSKLLFTFNLSERINMIIHESILIVTTSSLTVNGLAFLVLNDYCFGCSNRNGVSQVLQTSSLQVDPSVRPSGLKIAEHCQ